MKTAVAIIILLVYCISHGVYLYHVKYIPCTTTAYKLWNIYDIGGLFLAICCLQWLGIETYLEQQILTISQLLIIFTFVEIILYYNFITDNPYYLMSVIYGSTFVTSLAILISGGRHGAFKN